MRIYIFTDNKFGIGLHHAQTRYKPVVKIALFRFSRKLLTALVHLIRMCWRKGLCFRNAFFLKSRCPTTQKRPMA